MKLQAETTGATWNWRKTHTWNYADNIV